MKKPKLGEIRAGYEGMVAKDTGAFYLLDLVERMGKIVKSWSLALPDCKCEKCKEASALLEELRK